MGWRHGIGVNDILRGSVIDSNRTYNSVLVRILVETGLTISWLDHSEKNFTMTLGSKEEELGGKMG